MCHRFLPLGLLFLLHGPAITSAQRVVYVNSQAVGANDGTSWTNAFSDLQDALDDARNNDGCPCEIWITAGIYKPDRGTGDRGIAFEPPGNVSLYGGFAGFEECLDDRDWVKKETILSGDLRGDDDLNATGQSNCCGVTLQPGCEDAECAAIVYTRRPQCAQVWDSTCALMARDFCCEVCRTTLCDNSDAVLRLVEVSGSVMLNRLTVRGGNDFGLVSNRSDIIVDECTFAGNPGIGIVTFYGSASILRSCFSDNGLFDSYSSGGGVLNESNQAVVSDCEFLRNRGGGLGAESSAPIRRCTFRDNIGTALTIGEGYPTISDCVFLGNHAGDGAAVYSAFLSAPRIEDCVFLGNHAAAWGGAIYSNSGGGLTVVNSLFVGNSAGNGGAVLNQSGIVRMFNCTISGNFAETGGGIESGGGMQLTNSVVWGNHDQYGYLQSSQVYSLDPPTLRYNIVQGWSGSLGGVGNGGADPLFVDPSGPDSIQGTDDDDLRLLPGSPAINAGDPNPSGLPSTDLDGHARVLCDRVDIGAYEFGIGDYNCDQNVDLSDFANWSACMTGPHSGPYGTGCESFDFNADHSIDLLDFAALQPILSGQ
ncbi:MAG: right-handed parallel beta-helix repeat-containing protein [Planctomycetota bacterium]